MDEEVKVSSIQKLTIARQMLAEAKSMDDILHVRDIAEAARTYAKAAKLGLENQNEAAEVKIRAERKAGEMLAQMPMAIGTDYGGRTSLDGNRDLPSNPPPTLADLGIERMQSSRWQMIAGLPEDKFEEHITETKEWGKELTTAGLIREIQKENIIASHEEKRSRPLPDGKFQVIYADPPWQYENSGFIEAAENQYPTMPVDEICNLPIAELAESTSILFLWATNPLLQEAIKVLRAWGFDYKTNIAWIKDRGRGKGWFLKSKHELLLIGVRENTPHPVERPDSAQEADRGLVHSRKPEIFYHLIETMYPKGSKVELFARNNRPGWVSWGNEV